MKDKKKKDFVRPRIVRRCEKLSTIVQFATSGNAEKKAPDADK